MTSPDGGRLLAGRASLELVAARSTLPADRTSDERPRDPDETESPSRRPGAMTSVRAASTAAALAVTLGLATASWVVAVRQMSGMDMGVGTELGPFASFIGLWVLMMAAMMLPGALPAVLKRTDAGAGLLTAPIFAGSYLAVWALVGVAVYALYRPHGTLAAGVAAIAAGTYELTPIKLRFRRWCRERAGSGLMFGVHCVGSSIGLMLLLVVLGVMSVGWMAVVASLVLVQKLLPPRVAVDLLVALTIVGLGVLIVLAPSAVPGLMPSM